MADLIGINHGTATGHSNPDFYNSFPSTTPKVNATGIYSTDIELIETQVYQVGIMDDFKLHDAPNYPMLAFFSVIGGETLYQDFAMWTDSFEGNQPDFPIEQLRSRDPKGDGTMGTTTNRPLAIQNSAAFGGKLFWQKCWFADSAAATTYRADHFDSLADGDYLWVQSPYTTTMNDATYNASTCEAKELGFVQDSSNTKKLLVLGHRRTAGAANVYDHIVGHADNVIRKIENVLALRSYDYTSHTVTLNGTGSSTVYNLKYNSSTSKRVYLPYDYLTYGEQVSTTQTFDNLLDVIVGVEQFIYDAGRNTFIMILDFEDSNLEMLNYGTEITNATEAVAGTYYQVVSCLASARWTNATTGISHFTGDVAVGDGAAVDTGVYLVPLTTAFLLEEVNTATGDTTPTNRFFGANYDSSTQTVEGGQTRMGRVLLVNRHRNKVSGKSSREGFGTEEKGFYNFHTESHMNYVQYFISDTWSVEKTAESSNTKLKLNIDWIGKSRTSHLEEYKRDVFNTMMWGKKYQQTNSDGSYTGEMSGIMDPEMFNMRRFYIPIPISSGIMDTTLYEAFMDKVAKALHDGRTKGEYKNESTIFCSLEILRLISRANAALGSTNTTANPFGFQFTTPPPSELTLGLQVYKIKTMYGGLNFVHDPGFDFETGFEVPYHLFPAQSGKLNPKYLCIALDKSTIKFYTRAGREERIYGGLQSPNNPFIYTEGISGAHSIGMRDSRNNALLYMPPDA